MDRLLVAHRRNGVKMKVGDLFRYIHDSDKIPIGSIGIVVGERQNGFIIGLIGRTEYLLRIHHTEEIK